MVNEKEAKTCTLGIDFGSYKSKITLAYMNTIGGQMRIEIQRVPFDGGFDDPDRADTSTDPNSWLEFVAFAALENGQLVLGRRSLSHDCTLPLKTIFIHRAGITRQSTIKRLPGGVDLLEHCRAGTITPKMEAEALRKHFELLHRMATDTAKEVLGSVITKVVLSYPNYLCPKEQEDDFVKYTSYYKKLLRPIWGKEVSFNIISEGQAAALYVSEPFTDLQVGFKRDRLWRNLKEGMGKKSGLSLLIPDGGSSSLNIQMQSVFFNEVGELASSQSISASDWLTGVQGGSHMSNFAIRQKIVEELRSYQFPPGEIAALLNDFERRKRQLDWTTTEAIDLHGTRSGCIVSIFPKTLQTAFNAAFGDGLAMLEREVWRVLGLGQDFAVILCGGSYFCKGLRNLVEKILTEVEMEAESRGIRVKHLYLGEYDIFSSSAVSAGAALSVMRVPCPVDVFDGSAIAVHKLWKSSSSAAWEGEDEATFLFSKGCGERNHARCRNDPEGTEVLKFALVCDPNYYPKRSPDASRDEGGDRLSEVRTGAGRRTKFKPIQIESPSETIHDSIGVYDLGFSVPATDLPKGRLHFRLSGPSADMLAKDINIEGSSDVKSLVFELTCHKIDKKGKRRRHQLDKRWLLRVTTDPSTKLLVVEEEKVLPVWCGLCDQVIHSTAYQCTVCLDFSICWDCRSSYKMARLHDASHGWKCISDEISTDTE